MDTDINTEQKVLQAAKKVFVTYGYEGSSMQKIASEAGINKALLHYYFRSKDKLFEAAFLDIFSKFAPRLQSIFESESGFYEKLHQFVHSYLDILYNEPLVPIFILQEINRNPDILIQNFTRSGLSPAFFIQQVEIEKSKGNIREIDPGHLFINILALCIFPVAARPLLQRVFFNNQHEDYDQFLEERKKEVIDFITNAIRKI